MVFINTLVEKSCTLRGARRGNEEFWGLNLPFSFGGHFCLCTESDITYLRNLGG